MDGQKLKQMIDRLAREAGFDLVAVSDASEFTDDREKALERINAGLMDGLAWYTSGRVNRGANPEALLPGARSIVSLGWNYYVPDASGDAAGHGRVARYARGRDYHRVMKRRMRQLVRGIAEELGEGFAARWFVDDGPMLDRAAASRAGLGWFGKNGNILTPTLGSWVLLGQIITDLDLPADAALMKTCGACTRCIPACPTDAIVAPYVVDNQRCISYLTIEHKGTIPRDLRAAMGTWVFGCDICQDVCPVNRKARQTEDPNFGRRDLSGLELVELLEMGEAEFAERFAGTPIMRAKWIGMQRNACIALGNAGDPRAVPALATALREAAPLVRSHAAWSLGRIGGELAALALEGSLQTETDADVTAEILAALTDMKSHS